VNAGYGIQIVHVGARPVLRCNIAVAVVDVQVRRAGPSDVTTIERIVHEAFGKYVARNGRQPAPMGADNHAAVALSRVWVIEADGEIAGSWSTRCTTTIYCSTPSQSPPARRGTVIVRCCSPVPRTTPRELGLSEVRLLTNQAMTENQTFYPRHGYIETARGRQGGYDCVFLRQKVAACQRRQLVSFRLPLTLRSNPSESIHRGLHN
jgi:hypothetical protein